MEVHIYISNPNFPEMETGESEGEWQSWLLSDLEATLWNTGDLCQEKGSLN